MEQFLDKKPNLVTYGYTTTEDNVYELQAYLDMEEEIVYLTANYTSFKKASFEELGITKEDTKEVFRTDKEEDEPLSFLDSMINILLTEFDTYRESLMLTQTVHYNHDKDTMELWVMGIDKKLHLKKSFPLIAGKEGQDTEYVHFGILVEIYRNSEAGYTFTTVPQ